VCTCHIRLALSTYSEPIVSYFAIKLIIALRNVSVSVLAGCVRRYSTLEVKFIILRIAMHVGDFGCRD
jgi:hypothetical protein